MEEFNNLSNIVGDRHVSTHRVLAAAVGKLTSVVVIGIENDGSLYLAASDRLTHSLYLAERAVEDLKERLKA